MPHSIHDSSPKMSPSQKDDISQRYWNANVPPNQWTEECPAFLVGSSDKDKHIIGTRDEKYHFHTWTEVQELVKSNRLELFQRLPSDLRRYRNYIYNLNKDYGSVLAFVQQERLNWENAVPSGDAPYVNPEDYRILYNDWPYGVEPDVKHLVVWTKYLLDEDEETGDLTPRARACIEAFVKRTFCGEDGVSRDQLTWFRNWKSLKSVHALEHFHVMVFKASDDFLRRITQGDLPTSAVVSQQKDTSLPSDPRVNIGKEN